MVRRGVRLGCDGMERCGNFWRVLGGFFGGGVRLDGWLA